MAGRQGTILSGLNPKQSSNCGPTNSQKNISFLKRRQIWILLDYILLKGPAGRDTHRTLQSRSVPLLPRPTPMHLLETVIRIWRGGGRTKIPRPWGPQLPPYLLTLGWWPPPRPELAPWRQRSRHRDSRTTSSSACPAPGRSRCGDPRTPGGSEEAQWEGPWLRRDVLGKLGLPLIRLSPQVSSALVSADFCRKYLEKRKILQGLAGGVGAGSWSSARMSSLSQFL